MEVRPIDPDRNIFLNAGVGIPLECIPPKKTRVLKAGPSCSSTNPAPAPTIQLITLNAGRGGRRYPSTVSSGAGVRTSSPNRAPTPAPPAHVTINDLLRLIDGRVQEDLHIVLLSFTWLKYRIRARLARFWNGYSAWADPNMVRVNGRWLTRAEAEKYLKQQGGGF